MNTTIQEQMEINEQAYLIASKSKESAIRFLEDAGIIKKQPLLDTTPKHPECTTIKNDHPDYSNLINF